MSSRHGSAATPSQTALFAALRRTLAYKADSPKYFGPKKFGPDYLAENFLPPHFRFFLKFAKVRENTRQRLAAAMPGLHEYLIARTQFFDELFVHALNMQIQQIVLLGAGYDTRPYRFAQSLGAANIFELDAPATQQRKIDCLGERRISVPSGVHFVSVDLAHAALGDVLAKARYRVQERALFLWEGVSYYLDRETVERTLSFVGCSTHPESIIAFDYCLTLPKQELANYYGAVEFFQAMHEQHAQEGLVFTLAPGELEPFLVKNRLRPITHLDPPAIADRYLLDDTGASIGRISEVFCLACASPLR